MSESHAHTLHRQWSTLRHRQSKRSQKSKTLKNTTWTKTLVIQVLEAERGGIVEGYRYTLTSLTGISGRNCLAPEPCHANFSLHVSRTFLFLTSAPEGCVSSTMRGEGFWEIELPTAGGDGNKGHKISVFREPVSSWTSALKVVAVSAKECVFLRPWWWGEAFELWPSGRKGQECPPEI